MADREKVINWLECCSDTEYDCALQNDCPYSSNYGEGCMLELKKDALSLLKAQESGWISVDEHLPERGILILTATYGTDIIMQQEGETREEAIERSRHGKGRVDTGFIDRDGYWCSGDGFPSVILPKYWMLLPEPPKEE